MSETRFESWAVVELFGHQRVAGRVSEQAVGGCNFVRVDIPKGDGFYTRLFGNGAIYAINVTDEVAARLAAERFVSQPAYAWELENAQQRLAAPADDGIKCDADYDDDESCF